jgi:hypothetical protein
MTAANLIIVILTTVTKPKQMIWSGNYKLF